MCRYSYHNICSTTSNWVWGREVDRVVVVGIVIGYICEGNDDLALADSVLGDEVSRVEGPESAFS
jgi:hypothetical protein